MNPTRPRPQRTFRPGRLILGIGAGLLLAAPGGAQEPSPVQLPPQSPESYLGFRPGEDRQVVDWGQVTGYLADLARSSARALGASWASAPAGANTRIQAVSRPVVKRTNVKRTNGFVPRRERPESDASEESSRAGY